MAAADENQSIVEVALSRYLELSTSNECALLYALHKRVSAIKNRTQFGTIGYHNGLDTDSENRNWNRFINSF